MQEIINHHIGPVAFDKSNLRQIVCSLRNQKTQRPSQLSSSGAESPNAEEDFAIDPVSSTTASKTLDLQ